MKRASDKFVDDHKSSPACPGEIVALREALPVRGRSTGSGPAGYLDWWLSPGHHALVVATDGAWLLLLAHRTGQLGWFHRLSTEVVPP